MYLYLRESPRALILCAQDNTRALVFSSTFEDARIGRVTVNFVPSRSLDFSVLLKLTPRPVKGCLGLINIPPNGNVLFSIIHMPPKSLIGSDTDLFVAIVTSASDLGNILPSAESPHFVSKIHEVAFYSLVNPAYDDFQSSSDSITSDSQEYLSGTSPYEHPCAPIMKILSSGTFYYAPYPHWNISSRLSERISNKQLNQYDLGDFDGRFVWNEYVIKSLLDFRERLEAEERREFDRSQFVVCVKRGRPTSILIRL